MLQSKSFIQKMKQGKVVKVTLSSSLLVNLHRGIGLEVLIVNGLNQGLHTFIAKISLYGSLDI
ncbi:hypothetical protein Hdeb2414_s0023g00641501 [Helianthus debilis subsp. tardiflorus]